MTLPSETPENHVDEAALACVPEDLNDAIELPNIGLPGERGFLPLEFVMMNLPYRRLNDTDWVRVNGNDRMTITARRFTATSGKQERFIPYGKHARAVLLFLMTRVKLTKSQDIELGSSFRSFAKAVGIPYNGRNSRAAMDQLLALLHCTFDFNVIDTSQDGYLGLKNLSYPVSDEYSLWFDLRSERLNEDGLLASTVRINKGMFDSIMSDRTRPIELAKYAQVASGKSPLATDIFVWVSSKVYGAVWQKKSSVRVTWEQLHGQFGSQATVNQFKKDFEKALDVVLKVEMNAWAFISKPGQQGVSQRKGFKGVILGYKDVETEPKDGVMGYAKKTTGTPKLEPKTAATEEAPPAIEVGTNAPWEHGESPF